MRFNVTIGNPPYQESTGGGGFIETSIAIYDDFVLRGTEISYRCVIVIPARWLTGGQYKIDNFRYKMAVSKHVERIKYYRNSRALFDNVSIAGGIMILCYDNTRKHDKCWFCGRDIDISKYRYTDRKGAMQYMIPHDIMAYNIIDKIGDQRISDDMLPVNPFRPVNDKPTQNTEFIGKYKVCVSKVSADTGYINDDCNYKVLYDTFIMKPGDFGGIEYLVLGCFDSYVEALNFKKYIDTKIVRYLIWITVSGMNLTARNFMFVPKLDMHRSWTDVDLRSILDIDDTTWRNIDYLIAG